MNGYELAYFVVVVAVAAVLVVVVLDGAFPEIVIAMAMAQLALALLLVAPVPWQAKVAGLVVVALARPAVSTGRRDPTPGPDPSLEIY